LELKSIASVVEELMRRSWNNKRWTTKKGNERGGNEFKRATIQFLLTNVTYIGKVKYRGELFDGEQEAIIDETVFNQVQALLAKNRTSPLGKRQKKKNKGPLVDRLFCMKCGTRMNETYTIKNNRKYRYYACLNRTGGDEVGPKCSWVPANKLEQAIFDEIWRERYSGLSAIRPKLTSSCRGKLIRKNSDKVFVDPDGNEIEIQLAQFNNAANDFGWRDDCDENQNKPK
jgi:site-specific DNA recombinase